MTQARERPFWHGSDVVQQKPGCRVRGGHRFGSPMTYGGSFNALLILSRWNSDGVACLAQTSNNPPVALTGMAPAQGLPVMRLRLRSNVTTPLAASLLAVLACACSQKPVAPAVTTPAPAAPTGETVAQAQPAQPIDDHTIHGSNKKLVHPVAVFVDDEQVAVLRPGELPPGLTLVDNAAEGQSEKRYYRLAEYLQKIGVDLGAVKTVHMEGHRDHIASLEGSELRAQKDRFVFDFGHMMSRMPKSCWSTTGLKNALRIDTIRNIAVYANKAAPALDGKKHCYLAEDGSCAPAHDPKAASAKGTRVYVDGKMLGFVKRRSVGETAVLAGDDYSLNKYLSGLGVDLKSAKGIEFVAGDDIVGRAVTTQINAKSDFVFSIPRHSHGRIVARLEPSLMSGQETDRSVPVTAIQVYRKAAPTDRPLKVVTDEDIASASRLGAEQTELGSIAEDGEEQG